VFTREDHPRETPSYVVSLLALVRSATFCIVTNATLSPARLLGELIEPLARGFTPESARAILAVRPSNAARRHIAELAKRCDRGMLGPEEKAEYQLYVDVGDAIALIQTRARLYLKQKTS
jgi:hypothetical protein